MEDIIRRLERIELNQKEIRRELAEIKKSQIEKATENPKEENKTRPLQVGDKVIVTTKKDFLGRPVKGRITAFTAKRVTVNLGRTAGEGHFAAHNLVKIEE